MRFFDKLPPVLRHRGCFVPAKILPFCHEGGRLRAIFARGGRIVHNFCGITCMHKKSIIRICRVSPCGSAKAAEQKVNDGLFGGRGSTEGATMLKLGKKSSVDLLSGDEGWVIFKFSVPIILSYLLQQIYTISDAAICGLWPDRRAPPRWM